MSRSALVPSLLLVLAATAAPAADDNPRNLQRVTEVELAELLAQPSALTEAEVKFRATFCQVADLHDTLHTWFKPEYYANIIVWDDRATLWEGDNRAKIVTTLYLPRERFPAKKLAGYQKYQQVEIAGRVRAVVDGQPQFEVDEILPIAGAGAFSDQAIYHIEQALLLVKDDKRDLAEDHFASAAAMTLPLAAALDLAVLRGRNLLQAGSVDAAESVLSSAVADLPKDKLRSNADRSVLLGLLAKAQVEQAEKSGGGQGTAVANARTALELDPSNGEALAVLGIGLAGLGQFDEARRACDRAVRLRPTDAETRWYLGRILDQQGRGDEAIEALKKAIDLTPKDHRIHLAIANAYHHRGKQGGSQAATDLALALQEYDITLRLNPGDVAVIHASGLVIEDAAAKNIEVKVGGNKVPASRTLAYNRYVEALALDAKHVPSLTAAGRLAARLGRFAESERCIERLRAEGAATQAAEVQQYLEKMKTLIKSPGKAPSAKAPDAAATTPVESPSPAETPVEAPAAIEAPREAAPSEVALPPSEPVEAAPAEPVPAMDAGAPATMPEASPESLAVPAETAPADAAPAPEVPAESIPPVPPAP